MMRAGRTEDPDDPCKRCLGAGSHVQRFDCQPDRLDPDHFSSSRIQAAHSAAAIAGQVTAMRVAPWCSSMRMADAQVACISKPHPESPHEHITHLGNPTATTPWVWTREQVIASIDAKTNTFYVLDPVSGKRGDIGVVREAGKIPYLHTYADGKWTNNLLSLNQCPL